jgi:hypothetical protein
MNSSTCGACRHPQHKALDEAVMRGDLRLKIARRFSLSQNQVESHATRHLPTLWERCRACAQQMFTGERCYEHNPTPELRAAMVESTR